MPDEPARASRTLTMAELERLVDVLASFRLDGVLPENVRAEVTTLYYLSRAELERLQLLDQMESRG